MAKTSTKTRRSTEDRREQISKLTGALDEFVEDSDDATLAALTALWDGYSERNAWLIGMQRPDATDVDGYRAWQARGRQVRRGETGISILAPAGQGEDVKDEAGNVEKPGRPYFRIATVFDVAQTDEIKEGD